jgi:hypothetical protein
VIARGADALGHHEIIVRHRRRGCRHSCAHSPPRVFLNRTHMGPEPLTR